MPQWQGAVLELLQPPGPAATQSYAWFCARSVEYTIPEVSPPAPQRGVRCSQLSAWQEQAGSTRAGGRRATLVLCPNVPCA